MPCLLRKSESLEAANRKNKMESMFSGRPQKPVTKSSLELKKEDFLNTVLYQSLCINGLG